MTKGEINQSKYFDPFTRLIGLEVEELRQDGVTAKARLKPGFFLRGILPSAFQPRLTRGPKPKAPPCGDFAPQAAALNPTGIRCPLKKVFSFSF